MKEDIEKVLVTFPESWRRSKREYVKLVVSKAPDSSSSIDLVWLGHKSNFSPNRNKAKIVYDEDDIKRLETAPDLSVLQVRSGHSEFRFEKQSGKWVQLGEKI